MSYLVIARKHRPTSFAEVTGQRHVTQTLMNAIERDQIAHAYLFAGPRGVGKTSVARIFSKALNAEGGPSVSPDPSSKNSKEIDAGTSLAVREIDGASHNSVENVRELIDSFRSLPPPGYRFKVYIIDEVHMLSTAAFNALLKSLEEPPPNTVFILATTEAHKIPDTVLSRCQRHDFRALSIADISERLANICEQESIAASEDALRLIARLAEGSMRDSQSLLERVRAFESGEITAQAVSATLGTVNREGLIGLVQGVVERRPAVCLSMLEQIFSSGVDPALFIKEFVNFWRELLFVKFAEDEVLREMGIEGSERERCAELVAALSEHDVQDLAQLAREGGDNALRSYHVRFALEGLIVRMASRVPVRDFGQILDKLRPLTKTLPRQRTHHGENLPGRSASMRDAAQQDQDPVQQDPVQRDMGAEPAQQPSETPVVSENEAAADVDGEMMRLVAATTAHPMLCEHLRRVRATEFRDGTLHLCGPEVSIAYLEQPEQRKKLDGILRSVFADQDWSVRFQRSDANGGIEEGSILHQQKKDQLERTKKQRAETYQHPKVKTLREAFPGSTIESIQTRNKA